MRIPITGTIVSRAFVDGSVWKDKVATNVWAQSVCLTLDTVTKPITVRNDQNSRIPGKGYVYLDGDYLHAKNVLNPIGKDEDYTISIWIRPEYDLIPDIIAFGVDSYQGERPLVLLLDQSTVGYSYCLYGTGWIQRSGAKLEIKKWNHCVINRKDGRTFMFLNGKFIEPLAGAFIAPPDKLKNPPYPVLTDAKYITTNIDGRLSYGANAANKYDKMYDEIVVIKGQALWTNTKHDFTYKKVQFFDDGTAEIGDIVKDHSDVVKLY